MTVSLYNFIRTTVCVYALFFLAACGGDASSGSVVEPPPSTPVTGPGEGADVLNASALASMPQANSANVAATTDGLSTVLKMSTLATVAFAPGAFVGGGTGNKVITGLPGFDGLPLSALNTVEVDAKLVTGPASLFYMNFLVDLDCVKDEDTSVLSLADLRARRRILVWNTTAGVLQPDGYTRFSANSSDTVWYIVGTPTLGLGPNPSGPATTLTAFSGSPNACIVDGVSGDAGLLRNVAVPSCVTPGGLPGTALAQCGLPHKGALLMLGDSGNLTAREVWVKRLKIKNREITFAP
jgi:hypothetical protein